jgi:putative endonuclease
MAVADDRHHRGRMAFHAGVAAEMRIAQDYERRGFTIARRRWRGAGGEIDLIVRDGTGLIFVEVKKSRSLARAAESLSSRQMRRIYASAEEFLGTEPLGSLTDVRFDVALVDRSGDLQIIENAFGHG